MGCLPPYTFGRAELFVPRLAPPPRSATFDRRVGIQTVSGRTARQRRSWALPPCCSSVALVTWGGRATHGRAFLLHSVVGDQIRVHTTTEPCRGGTCPADTGLVLGTCCASVLPWNGPAPARARGASTKQPEGCSYASWRERCGVKLSAHEPQGGGRPRSPYSAPHTPRCSTHRSSSAAGSGSLKKYPWARSQPRPNSSSSVSRSSTPSATTVRFKLWLRSTTERMT